jgi:hypothetical protein
MCFVPQVLSELDITVPLQLLISMFSDGVNSVKELANQRKSRANELAGNLASRRVSITMTVHVLLVKVWEASASYAGLEEASLEFSLERLYHVPFH